MLTNACRAKVNRLKRDALQYRSRDACPFSPRPQMSTLISGSSSLALRVTGCVFLSLRL
ncbi:hypothetical protein MESS4_530045 [Mesorhizobium sp. STM 4661]|nr:hypothetical protein MESS4_530045 [Mesorhizobium sp. STM 4661]